MSRPLLPKKTVELEQLFFEWQGSPAQLRILKAELKHRRRPKALRLRERVEAILAVDVTRSKSPSRSQRTDSAVQERKPHHASKMREREKAAERARNRERLRQQIIAQSPEMTGFVKKSSKNTFLGRCPRIGDRIDDVIFHGGEPHYDSRDDGEGSDEFVLVFCGEDEDHWVMCRDGITVGVWNQKPARGEKGDKSN